MVEELIQASLATNDRSHWTRRSHVNPGPQRRKGGAQVRAIWLLVDSPLAKFECFERELMGQSVVGWMYLSPG